MFWYTNPQAVRAVHEVVHGTEDDRRRQHVAIARRKR